MHYPYYNKKFEIRDRIRITFEYLRKKGLLARMNFLCCQNCAGYAMTEIAVKMVDKGKKVLGSVYWHNQDEEQFQKDGTLYLAYGNLESTKNGTIGLSTVEVGYMVYAELRKQGLIVAWDGDPDQRMMVCSSLSQMFDY
jgi:hypothetical protein